MKNQEDTLNLGADQIGELYGFVQPLLCERETFIIQRTLAPKMDDLWIKVLGSKGTNLLIEMTDSGWAYIGRL